MCCCPSQDERDAIVAKSVNEIERTTILYNTVRLELKDKKAEAEQLKACLEGEFGLRCGRGDFLP